MGVWTVSITLGVPFAPLIFGFVAFRVDYRWIYWILAIVSSFCLVVMLGIMTNLGADQRRPIRNPPALRRRDALVP